MTENQFYSVTRDVFLKMGSWEEEHATGSARSAFVHAWDEAVRDDLLVVEGHERNLWFSKAWNEWLTRGQPLGQDRVDQVKAYYLKPRR